MTARMAVAAVAICAAAMPVAVRAAPAGMLNKTVSLAFEVSIPAKNAAGSTIAARRSTQLNWYVSSAGRVFSRRVRHAGRAAETTEVALGAISDGAPRIEGNTIIATVGRISGATRIVVSFDSSFQSCTARVILGRESGKAFTWKGLNGQVYTATGPASVSTPSCSVQSGNFLAGQ